MPAVFWGLLTATVSFFCTFVLLVVEALIITGVDGFACCLWPAATSLEAAATCVPVDGGLAAGPIVSFLPLFTSIGLPLLSATSVGAPGLTGLSAVGTLPDGWICQSSFATGRESPYDSNQPVGAVLGPARAFSPAAPLELISSAKPLRWKLPLPLQKPPHCCSFSRLAVQWQWFHLP